MARVNADRNLLFGVLALQMDFSSREDLIAAVSASGSPDKTVKVWDAATGQEALTLKGHTSIVTGVAFSPDGRRIASGSADKTVKVRDSTRVK